MHRRPAAVVVAALLVGACSSDNGGGFVAPTTTTTAPSLAPTTTAVLGSTTTVLRPEAGTVTLRVTGLTLPGAGASGSGLQVLVRAASPQLFVHRRGGAGAVTVCPVAEPAGRSGPDRCVDLAPSGAVVTVAAGGLDVRATGPLATLDELAVNYLPAARSTTIVTPARPAGACEVPACEATFSLTPGGAGAFVLDGRAGGGRPRLVLSSVGAAGSNRMLATVEGGGSLSIRATIEAGSEARLLHHEQGPDAVVPATAEISWP